MSKKLLQSISVVAGMTLVSRVLGLVREIIFASCFGAAAGMDAFLVAFRIPNFMRRLFAEGSFSQAFVPVLSEYLHDKDRKEVQLFIDRMAGNLGLILFAVSVIGVLLAPLLVIVFAPGFLHDTARLHLATGMLRLTFPYVMFVSLTAFAGGIMNCRGKFAIPAVTPALLNLTLVVAAICLAPHLAEPITALAWGVFVGGILQLLLQLPYLKSLHLSPRPRVCWHDSGVKKVLKLMVPALLGVSIAQLSLLLDTLFASFLQVGSVSWLYYSARLTYFPQGVFAVALATVILPHLSRKFAAKSTLKFSQSLDWALRCVLVIGVPAALGMLLLAEPIMATLFQYGAFKSNDVIMAGRSLMAFAFGVPAYMLIKVLASGFYSRQNIKTPVKIAALAMLVNFILNFSLIFFLAHVGLALATSIAALLNAGLLWFYLLKRKIYRPQAGWFKYLLQLLFANVVLLLLLWFATAKVAVWLDWGWQQRVVHLLGLISAALVVYVVALVLSGVRMKDFHSES